MNCVGLKLDELGNPDVLLLPSLVLFDTDRYEA
jgi:hypothetical protein